MGFTQVYVRYNQAKSKVCSRAWAKREGKFTPKEQKAMAHYGQAAQQIKALCSEDPEEGFAVREYVPAYMRFENPKEETSGQAAHRDNA